MWKLLYAYMLGYEIDDTGHFQVLPAECLRCGQRGASQPRRAEAVELCSSPKFSEKTAGPETQCDPVEKMAAASAASRRLPRYLATSLLLADNNDMVRMIVNSVKTDISSGNEAPTCRWGHLSLSLSLSVAARSTWRRLP